jgi:hypothetical protein
LHFLMKSVLNFMICFFIGFEKMDENADYSGCIVFMKHVPDGFHEKELYDFFSQFTKVLGVRVHRNSKTGNSRGILYLYLIRLSINFF